MTILSYTKYTLLAVCLTFGCRASAQKHFDATKDFSTAETTGPVLHAETANAMRPDGATDSIAMRREADAFLAGLPAGLQPRQAKAVAAAINGDFALLNEVRNARNSTFIYSNNVAVTELSIRGDHGREIAMRLYTPHQKSDTAPLPLLIYFHGGGWTFGSLNSCARFCDALAATGKVCVLAVDYALAPEHPYPEGLLDCLAAVEYAMAHCEAWGVSRQAISLGGDSSGGNLALAAALNLHRDGGNGGCDSNGGKNDKDSRNDTETSIPNKSYNSRNGNSNGRDTDHHGNHDRTPLKSLVLFYPVVLAENDESESWQQYGDGFGLDASLMMQFNAAYRARDGQNRQSSAPYDQAGHTGLDDGLPRADRQNERHRKNERHPEAPKRPTHAETHNPYPPHTETVAETVITTVTENVAETETDRASISPLYASDSALRDLPPILMINAERDILCGQGHQFARRVAAVGGSIRHIVFPGTVHLFITVPSQDRAFTQSVAQTVSYLRE